MTVNPLVNVLVFARDAVAFTHSNLLSIWSRWILLPHNYACATWGTKRPAVHAAHIHCCCSCRSMLDCYLTTTVSISRICHRSTKTQNHFDPGTCTSIWIADMNRTGRHCIHHFVKVSSEGITGNNQHLFSKIIRHRRVKCNNVLLEKQLKKEACGGPGCWLYSPLDMNDNQHIRRGRVAPFNPNPRWPSGYFLVLEELARSRNIAVRSNACVGKIQTIRPRFQSSASANPKSAIRNPPSLTPAPA